jgi:hypothetical protein
LHAQNEQSVLLRFCISVANTVKKAAPVYRPRAAATTGLPKSPNHWKNRTRKGWTAFAMFQVSSFKFQDFRWKTRFFILFHHHSCHLLTVFVPFMDIAGVYRKIIANSFRSFYGDY